MAATSLAIEFALMPFALYHFHRSGLYGVGANIIAIPLTTFVIMPLQALALLLDPLGIAAPAWWAPAPGSPIAAAVLSGGSC